MTVTGHRRMSVLIPRNGLPPEILDRIVLLLVSDTAGFPAIASLSLVSWQFRQLAFRRYYATLRVRSARHWVRSCRIDGMYSWVRSLDTSTPFFQYKLDALSRFASLQDLTLDFSADGLATQRSRCLLLFKNVTAGLSSLKLTHLPRIDVTLLSLLAGRFPALSKLELSCTERLDEQCCWLCYEESSSCVVHSPIPDCFPSAERLASVFGNALKPLRKLEHLFLGIFLSGADMLNCHFDRCATVVILSPRTGWYSSPPFGPDRCEICLVEHGATVRERERIASALLAKLLPSLETIGWSTYFAKDRPGDDVERKATVLARDSLEGKAAMGRRGSALDKAG
ncbi:hypothetical protein K466DRAFT_644575 [Polyporus arcularius HHB13444]|uniref:F-box domain-containing protein n=1 Tax=Polyporus arcularius HHB13444 TaxID=1314778 RepID=A0A5C3PPF3_9APHY|nr:hypothetical protein K466DRAFT_644575 [Polyporus arcularius HHB13444]